MLAVTVGLIGVTNRRVTAMTGEEVAALAPVCRLDPAAHKHHDVLAAVLDMFAALQSDCSARWMLAHCVACQLIRCRCKEGVAIRRAVRSMAGCRRAHGVPIAVVAGLGVCERRGNGTGFRTKRGKWVNCKRYYKEGRKWRAYPSTRITAVSVDVVLALAGLAKLLPSVLPPAVGSN